MIWKTIPGYEDYEITEGGQVRKVRGPTKKTLPYVLSQYTNKQGYSAVTLRVDGHSRARTVHRLVAITFLGPPPTERHEVAHYDGIRTNPHVSNLRWATHKENFSDKERHGTLIKGSDLASSKLTEEIVPVIRAQHAAGLTLAKLGEMYEVDFSTIWALVQRKTWKHVP